MVIVAKWFHEPQETCLTQITSRPIDSNHIVRRNSPYLYRPRVHHGSQCGTAFPIHFRAASNTSRRPLMLKLKLYRADTIFRGRQQWHHCTGMISMTSAPISVSVSVDVRTACLVRVLWRILREACSAYRRGPVKCPTPSGGTKIADPVCRCRQSSPRRHRTVAIVYSAVGGSYLQDIRYSEPLTLIGPLLVSGLLFATFGVFGMPSKSPNAADAGPPFRTFPRQAVAPVNIIILARSPL